MKGLCIFLELQTFALTFRQTSSMHGRHAWRQGGVLTRPYKPDFGHALCADLRASAFWGARRRGAVAAGRPSGGRPRVVHIFQARFYPVRNGPDSRQSELISQLVNSPGHCRRLGEKLCGTFSTEPNCRRQRTMTGDHQYFYVGADIILCQTFFMFSFFWVMEDLART